jgi:pyruvate,water dikinase
MAMTALILNWRRAYEAGVLSCGGKGYHLAKLHGYGFPVPDGGVVVPDVYRQLIHMPGLAGSLRAVSNLRAEEVTEPMATQALLRLEQGITTAVLPMQVWTELESFLHECRLVDRVLAVRSSAVSEDGPNGSFAGIHRSVLHVRGVDAICRAVPQCFASLWMPTAVSYRRRLGFADDDVLCAVVLCAMVTTPGGDEPQSAGVAFSCDPRTGRCDPFVINAARGIGESVVSGVVDPDHIEMRQVRGQLRLHRRTTPATPVLTPEQECELAYHVWRVHWAMGDGDHQQDVEWAHDGAQFWILQAQLVTRLPHYTFEAIQHLPVIWSTANIKDAMPGVVSMFAWSMIMEAIDGILYAGPQLLGGDIGQTFDALTMAAAPVARGPGAAGLCLARNG